MLKKLCKQFDIVSQCKKYGVPVWQCPQLLFLIMGFSVIATVLLTYSIGTNYIEDPLIVTLIVIFLTIFLMIVSYIITQGFERLAEVARIKSQFVSIVFHHLRSPVTNLRWALEVLTSGRAGLIGEQQKEYFEILKENTKRIDVLLKDLLIVSRLESKDLSYNNKKRISLVEITKKTISDLNDLARSVDAEINLNTENGLPEIFMDPYHVEIVIENLLENAIRYAKKEEKTKVNITLEKKGRKIYFKVKDDGIGIPPQDKKYIFQKFFRSTNAAKYQVLGSGLGLYISRAIIENLGGKMGFESEEGKGSTFWFYLPIK